MGSEDEAEQSIGRPYRHMNGRCKRTSELTSSIVPRGTSFHRREPRMNDAFGDTLVVKVKNLFAQHEIFKQSRAAGT
jgi:hypothetical protein